MHVSEAPGELPPSPPRACFGRDHIIEEIVALAEIFEPTALIGAGGIGKTSIALKVLHHNRIKQRFKENRRFIRCEKFPATLPHFLSRLSKATGAGIENPEDLASLIPFLSSKEMFIVLDNAESILDPQGANSREIYASVEELCRLDNISLCITSRISTVPPDCETLDVPTLSMESACDAFYRIYKRRERSDVVDNILNQLDFHPLSITLLATVAHQNRWNIGRLTREWEGRRTGALEAEHQTSLATTIELSLVSPLFKELGPDARGLLGVVAFYPQGVNENNLDWLFPTIPNVSRILDKFCVLSLTYRSDGFITMLAPLRDRLHPQNIKSSPLLCTTKDRYFARLSADFNPNLPGFQNTQWIVSEDLNVEHLLDVLTSVDPDSKDIWDACINFIRHLEWYKPRQIVLRSKIEALPENHHSKPECLLQLGMLVGSIGNFPEEARFLESALKLERERGNDNRVAFTLWRLSDANLMLGFHKEGIHQAKEALEIYQRLGRTVECAWCLDQLARLLYDDGQLDAAEEATLHSSKLLPEKGHEFEVCRNHGSLGDIYRCKGQREKALHHYEVVLGIASSFNWHTRLFWTYSSLAELSLAEDEFDGAYARLEQAKSHALNEPYYLGRAALLQARILHRQRRLEAATSEVRHAIEIFEKLGALRELEVCRAYLQDIEGEKESGTRLSWLDFSSKPLPRRQVPDLIILPHFSPRDIVQDPGGYSL
jgi:tetratricopeptide (TPR) repeat protein